MPKAAAKHRQDLANEVADFAKTCGWRPKRIRVSRSGSVYLYLVNAIHRYLLIRFADHPPRWEGDRAVLDVRDHDNNSFDHMLRTLSKAGDLRDRLKGRQTTRRQMARQELDYTDLSPLNDLRPIDYA